MIHFSSIKKLSYLRRGTSQSAPKYSLSLKKAPTVKKILTPLNMVPKKPCWSGLSELLGHLMSKLYGLVVRWLFVSRNGIKIQFLVVIGFKSSTLTVYCLSSWFIHKQPKTYSNLCVLCWLSHLSWSQGPKYFPSSFWPRVINHDIKSKFLKKWFFRSFLFYTTFSWCWKVREKT